MVTSSLSETLTQLFLSRPFFQKGDSLQDRPKHHTQREYVCLGRVGQPAPHLWSHVEVRTTGGGEVLSGQAAIHGALTHFAQTKICHLGVKEEKEKPARLRLAYSLGLVSSMCHQ